MTNFDIKKLSTTAYRPSSNGICERLNGTLQKKIKALLQETGREVHKWVTVLPTALMAIRNDPHATTGYTPSELLFSFRVKDLSLPALNDRYLCTNAQRAAKNIAVRRNRAAFRVRHENRVFERGSTVLVKAPSCGKLRLSGREARVVRQIDPHVVEVDDGDRTTMTSTDG